MQILESVVAGILVTLIIFLVYRLFKLKAFTKTLSELYMQELADKFLLSKKVEELMQEIENKKLEDTDGFLKFVSDSRDWAYTYIEDVQASLDKFITDIEPEIIYFDEYGDLMGAEPNYNSMKKISVAYKKLKELLPKDEQ